MDDDFFRIIFGYVIGIPILICIDFFINHCNRIYTKNHKGKEINKYLITTLHWLFGMIANIIILMGDYGYEIFNLYKLLCWFPDWLDDTTWCLAYFIEYGYPFWLPCTILYLLVIIYHIINDIQDKKRIKEQEKENQKPEYKITQDPAYTRIYSDEEVIHQYELEVMKAEKEVERLSNKKYHWYNTTSDFEQHSIDVKSAEEQLQNAKKNLRNVKKCIDFKKEICLTNKCYNFFNKLYPKFSSMTFNCPDRARAIPYYDNDHYNLVQNNLFILYVKYNLGLRFNNEKETLELMDISRYDETDRELLAGQFIRLCNMYWNIGDNFDFLYNWDNFFGWYTNAEKIKWTCNFSDKTEYKIKKFLRKRMSKAYDLRLEAENICDTVEIDRFEEVSSKRIDTLEWFNFLKSLNKKKWKNKNVFNGQSKFDDVCARPYSLYRETCHVKFYFRKTLKINPHNYDVGMIGRCLWYYLYSQKCETQILCVGSTLYRYLTNSERDQLPMCLRNKSKLKRLRKILNPELSDEDKLKIITEICNEN